MTIERVTISRTGGVLGLRPPTRQFSREELTGAALIALERLPIALNEGVRDGYVYIITVFRANGVPQTHQMPQEQIPAALAPLCKAADVLGLPASRVSVARPA